ncbi:MAG: TolC family protein [Bacteroidales bacterium]|nr:TolC family protein [Bacteroidales bacterium]
MLKKKVIFIFVLLAINITVGYSQEVDSSLYFNPITDDIQNKILPLEALIDSAIKNDPRVKLEALRVDYERYKVLSARRDWTRNLGFQGNLDYGNYYYYDRDELTRIDRFYLTESRRTNAAIGVYLRIPLLFIIDRRNEINKAKKMVEIMMMDRRTKIRVVRREVVEAYNSMLEQQALIRISNDYQQYSLVEMGMAELEFINGEIPASELTRLKDYQTQRYIAFAQSIWRFNYYLELLEEIVGIRFNLINKLK